MSPDGHFYNVRFDSQNPWNFFHGSLLVSCAEKSSHSIFVFVTIFHINRLNQGNIFIQHAFWKHCNFEANKLSGNAKLK